jgi:hypothetical protein
MDAGTGMGSEEEILNSDPEVVALKTFKGTVPKFTMVMLLLSTTCSPWWIVAQPKSTEHKDGRAGLYGKNRRESIEPVPTSGYE